jgi:hypothetical protein
MGISGGDNIASLGALHAAFVVVESRLHILTGIAIAVVVVLIVVIVVAIVTVVMRNLHWVVDSSVSGVNSTTRSLGALHAAFIMVLFGCLL